MKDMSWLPRSDAQFIVWLNHFRERLPYHQAALELTSAEVAAIDSDYRGYAYMLAQIEAIRAELQTRIDYKDMLKDGPESDLALPYPGNIILAEPPHVQVRPGILQRIQKLVSEIKDQKGYDASIGEDLGTEPKGVETIPDKPIGVTAVWNDGVVFIEFVSAGYDGVYVERQAGASTEWQPLGIFFDSPAVDARPSVDPKLAEARRYRLKFVQNNCECGLFSDEVQIIVPAQAERGSAAALR
jgi:hypothetical protein